MLRFDERVHLPKNRENTITFLVNGEPIGTVETLAPGAKTVDIPVPPIDYDSVTSALGYVPYDSTNPNGYISGINSSDVTTALGYTPLNTDASNLSSTGQEVFDGQWVFKSSELANGVTWNSTSHSGNKSYSLSSYLPNDGYKYEVLIRANGTTTATSGKFISIGISSDIITAQAYVCRCRTRSSSAVNCSGNVVLPVGTGRKIYVAGAGSDTSADGTYNIACLGYRRIGTNS